ncbi:MAG: hypothetical protein LBE65_00330 [Synergistaceae bacterium]|nr:hypothetical protein [Synergistaceae bacterium]
MKAEVDWLKKNPLKSTDCKRGFIEPENKEISIRRQRVLLGIQRSGYYCKPASESESNKALMEAIDRIYTSRPYYGSRRITKTLRRMPEWKDVKRSVRNTRNF